MTELGSALRSLTLRREAWIALGVLAAFLLGFGWQCARAGRLETALDETRRDLALARLESTLGAAAIEAQAGSYETSRQRASEFFTGLRGAADQSPPELRKELQRIQARRDATITMLARDNSESGNVLRRMFADYRAAVRRAQSARSTPPRAR